MEEMSDAIDPGLRATEKAECEADAEAERGAEADADSGLEATETPEATEAGTTEAGTGSAARVK